MTARPSMPTALENLRSGSRVLIVRLRSLGDCVLTTPAIRLLKQARPDLEIGIVVEDRFAGIFEDNPDIAAILPPLSSAAFGFRPDLTLNLHGGTRSMVLTTLSRARVRAGFAHHRGSSIYSIAIPRAQEILGEERKVHTAEHLASAMFYLGVPRTEIPRACLFAGPSSRRRPYAVLHPVSAVAEKTWPARAFLEVARALQSSGLQPVFVGGAGEDLSAFQDYETISGAPLPAIKTLLNGAALFIGNDSGPAHMAAAFGVPVVVLFGPSDPIVWAPWRTEAKVFHSPDGIGKIEAADVIASLEALRVKQ